MLGIIPRTPQRQTLNECHSLLYLSTVVVDFLNAFTQEKTHQTIVATQSSKKIKSSIIHNGFKLFMHTIADLLNHVNRLHIANKAYFSFYIFYLPILIIIKKYSILPLYDNFY